MSKVLLRFFNHRTLALLRWDLYFMRMRLANKLAGTAGRIRAHVTRMSEPRYMNLGSGPRGLVDSHWLNVDGFIDKNVHYRLDFSQTWPIPDGSMDGVFCEHVLEHFTLEDGIALLKQCCRILKPGGTARFIMPNAQIIMRTYFDSPELLVEKRLPNSGTPMEAVNGWFRQRYEHQCLYDWPLSEYAFKQAGFAEVMNSQFGKSHLVPTSLLIDDPKYAWESLYIDARKADAS
jgi:predicted SAM-dependent methyltransferase